MYKCTSRQHHCWVFSL